MLRDIPHLKTILILAFAGLVLGVVGLTWVYPAFVARATEVKQSKTREFCEGEFGVSGDSMELIKSGASLGHELADTVAGGEVRPPPSGERHTRTEATATTTEPEPTTDPSPE
ncbi:MAG: hypothetical protein ACP5KN_11100 [Armatimonadota bacterium]